MKTYLIDLDGTMYRGNSNIAGAKEFIDNCLKNHIPFFFLTNNATRTLRQNVEHMEKLGFKGIEEKHFFTSSMAAARIMRNNGFEISEEPQCLFVGLDKLGNYEKYSHALQYLLRGAILVGTNDDRLLAHGDTFHIGNGSIVKMFEYASGQTSMKIGKPHSAFLYEALDYYHLSKEECIIIGDNLETDIALGANEHVETILVLSGVHHEKDIERLKIYPDRIIHRLDELNQ